MMEQLDVPAGAPVARVSLGRARSDEARASLEAVRVAQEAARVRARVQTVRTRIWFAAAVGTVGLVALVLGLRMAGGRHARPKAPTSARPSPIGSPATEAVAADTSGPSLRAPEPAPSSPTAVSPVLAQGKARDGVDPEEGCDTGLIRRAPWRLSAQACERAFDADPSNAALALAIAHAEHAHGSIADAAQWAKRALSLDPDAAEAYVLIARADVAGGRREEARTAYRRYLELAPRGWHKAEARAAVTAAGPPARPDPAGDRKKP